MTLYKPGDVVLVEFPFASGVGSKLRPALVILDTGDVDLVVARITSQTSLIYEVTDSFRVASQASSTHSNCPTPSEARCIQSLLTRNVSSAARR